MAKKKEDIENKDVFEGKMEAGKKAQADVKSAQNLETVQARFQEKLRDLLALAKKKKNMLEYQEINDFFSEMQLNAEQFEKILDFLESNNIDVLRITDDDGDDDILLEVEEEEETPSVVTQP